MKTLRTLDAVVGQPAIHGMQLAALCGRQSCLQAAFQAAVDQITHAVRPYFRVFVSRRNRAAKAAKFAAYRGGGLKGRLQARLPATLVVGLMLLSGTAFAQPEDSSQKVQELERRVAALRKLLVDWGGLTRYGSENTELPPPKPTENRVVFLGDQVTENWGAGDSKFFPGEPYVNRGIAGQTTPQMLVRFHQDVVSLKPKVVVIAGGTNDLAAVMGPMTEGTMAENFISMVELAKANGIRVVLASVTPVCDCFTKQTGLRPQGKIIGLNGWIKDYAVKSDSVYLDYYSALADGRNLKKELTVDGLVPNDAGYSVMAPLAEKAIADALAKR